MTPTVDIHICHESYGRTLVVAPFVSVPRPPVPRLPSLRSAACQLGKNHHIHPERIDQRADVHGGIHQLI